MCALTLYGLLVGTIVEAPVGITVEFGVGVFVDGMAVIVGVGLGVRNSYVSGSTR